MVGVAVLATALSLIGGSCGSDNDSGRAADSVSDVSTTVDAKALAEEPRYEATGPYDVGVTTRSLEGGRAIEVYYPVAAGGTDGLAKATYLQTDALPANILASLPSPPPDVDLSVELPAVRDLQAASDGPFPIVVFSHGAGGWRGVYGIQLSGIASWGFVVASIDYPEYGLLASFTASGDDAARAAAREASRATTDPVAMSVVDLLAAESDGADGLLSGAVDDSRVAALGHSAGARTMFGLLDEPRVATIIGWAPVGPPTPVTSTTPTLIVAGGSDIAITPDGATASYDELLAPKRLAVIDTMGHNGFGDSCLAIRGGTDLIGIAKGLGLPIPDRLLELGRNGCEEGDLDTRTGWSVTQHFTVAHLRQLFGIDRDPVGLGDGIAGAFAPTKVTYRHNEA